MTGFSELRKPRMRRGLRGQLIEIFLFRGVQVMQSDAELAEEAEVRVSSPELLTSACGSALHYSFLSFVFVWSLVTPNFILAAKRTPRN